MVRSGYPSAKIILAGQISVGKTSIRRNFMGETFSSDYMKTIGAEVSYLENDQLNLTIFDLAGDPSFEHVRITLYTGTRAAVIVFDVTQPQTLAEVRRWIDEVRKYTAKDIPFIIVGNKLDLVDDVAQLEIHAQFEEVLAGFDDSYNIYPQPYYSSAKTGENIDAIFSNLSEMVLEQL